MSLTADRGTEELESAFDIGEPVLEPNWIWGLDLKNNNN